MVALEAKYHTKCLLALYNRARKVQVEQQGAYSEDDEISGIVFAELVMYVEEVRLEASTAPVFKLADMAQLYMSRMQQFGLTSDKRMHTTPLKQRLLAHFPAMRAQSKGRDIMLVFDENIGAALGKACEQDSDSDAIHLACAALFNLGLSISYDRVLHLSAEMGNHVCQRFHVEQVVCPPMLKGKQLLWIILTITPVLLLPTIPSMELEFPCYSIPLVLMKGCKMPQSSLEMLAQEMLVICHISILMCHLLHAV